MIEADLEKIVVDSFKAVLEDYDTQIYGTWQTTMMTTSLKKKKELSLC